MPGGSFVGSFEPIVTLSQNLLPFELSELYRYGVSLMALKLKILRYTQSQSFKSANGMIFLTKYAENSVLKVTGPLSGMIATIPHGLPSRFRMELKDQRPIEEYSETNPYRLIYVSSVDQYKHQWHLIEAVSFLRKQSIPVKLDLVGPAVPAALMKLNAAITNSIQKILGCAITVLYPMKSLTNFMRKLTWVCLRQVVKICQLFY